jgi:chromate reductase
MGARILVFSGSSRVESMNLKLARQGSNAIERAGGQPTLIDLRDFSLPLFDGDLEQAQGLPAPALELKRLFKAHDGFFIASPEYNASISPLLKNTIDWVSRATPTENGKIPYKGKVAALIGASPSPLGAYRGMAHLRQILSALGAWVLPDQMGISSGGGNPFAEDGSLRDANQQALLDAMAAGLVASAVRLAESPGTP